MLQGSNVCPSEEGRRPGCTGWKAEQGWEGSRGRKGIGAGRSPARKPADVFVGRELGEGGRARKRKRKRDSEPWESRTELRVCQTVADVQKEYWSTRRATMHEKTTLFLRIVNRKLINHVAVCTACLLNHASASLVKTKEKYLFKVTIKSHFKSSIHLKLLKLSLNLGKSYWRGETEVTVSPATWVLLWLICQTSF